MVNVFEKVVPDMKTEELNVELKNMGWHLLEKSSLTLSDRNVCWEPLKANKSAPPFEER